MQAPEEVPSVSLRDAPNRGMATLRSLPGARAETEAVGRELATMAKNLYRPLTAGEKAKTVIGVTRVRIDGEWQQVVSVNGGAPPTAVGTVRVAAQQQGRLFRQAPGIEHPDTYLYNEYAMAEGFQAIGVSHFRGPCSACRNWLE